MSFHVAPKNTIFLFHVEVPGGRSEEIRSQIILAGSVSPAIYFGRKVGKLAGTCVGIGTGSTYLALIFSVSAACQLPLIIDELMNNNSFVDTAIVPSVQLPSPPSSPTLRWYEERQPTSSVPRGYTPHAAPAAGGGAVSSAINFPTSSSALLPAMTYLLSASPAYIIFTNTHNIMMINHAVSMSHDSR